MIQSAGAAAADWVATPKTRRAELLRALAQRLDEERDRLVPLLGAEMGGVEQGSAGKTLDVAITAFHASADRATLDLDESFPRASPWAASCSPVSRRGSRSVWSPSSAPTTRRSSTSRRWAGPR